VDHGLPPGLGRRAQFADAAHALAGAEAVERIAQPRPVRQRQLRVQVEQRRQHEAPRGDLAVRQGQALGLELDVAEQQQVEVDRARAVPRRLEVPPQLALDLLADVEQRLGLEFRADPGGGVQEVGLVEDFADGLGLVEG
jgi:hypothetical protein